MVSEAKTVANDRRGIVAKFHKEPSGALRLFSLVTIEKTKNGLHRYFYDVDWSKKYGYLFDMSGFGGTGPAIVSGPYFASGDIEINETPTTLVDPGDAPPWQGKRTLVIRKRNRTRRLRRLPKAFDLEPDQDLLDWLHVNAIEDTAVYCSECRDRVPGDTLCDHCWWCDRIGWYSTPTERCSCKNRQECEE